MRRLLLFVLRVLFGFRAENTGVLQTPGPVLLLPNHASWVDWLFVAACIDFRWRVVTSKEGARVSWLHRFVMINRFTFPVEMDSPYAVKRMAEYLQGGGKLVIFPEGRLSRTGSLMKLFEGTGFLLLRTSAKVITCHLRGVAHLPFSPNPNRKQLLPRISAHFSDARTPPKFEGISALRARQKLTRWLSDQMASQQFDLEMAACPANVLADIIETARSRPRAVALQDVTRTKLTGRRLLAATAAMAAQWKTLLPAGSPERVAILLPNANAVPVTLMSLWAASKTPAILNFSAGVPTMLACAQLAEVKYIITSVAFLERVKWDLQPMKDAGLKFIYLEDVRAAISTGQRLAALAKAVFSPRSLAGPQRHKDPAVILFTSGSEGPPKGVELTHGNLLANMRQMLAVNDFVDEDRVFNALPLFHSFGLMGLLLPLTRGMFVFLYPSPLHYRVIPSLLYDLDCTVFFGTNTFLNGYARKAHPYDFRSLRMLVAGGEKLQEATAQVWARQFGSRILEGYGATECSPIITINTWLNPRYGSAGRFVPGIEHRFEPVDGVAEGGRLWVRGPNIMRGYLNAEPNAKFQAQGGWYDTGDIARVDDDGFLFILGRLKRFAKVSGEMVSLTAVEEALAGAFPQYGLRFQAAVLTRHDAERGEALVAVSNEPKLSLEEIRAAIKAKGLSNLCVPREVKCVREIPKLGTGKINHRELEKIVFPAPES
ncbi:MAG TPA: AMP-binding protein [Verrucomicrobiae bacterium]|jgi:acyl-[acyl-carrier-protein]-phospholipid O-acyltransferase/long-chain-fatty-acid--[acyl-carrier-protein] ligase